ncbi:hypothetical protein B0A49_00178 [Cryomyces minteri]|uniref:Uncharacterized protein n=1 Tax=Cryomyces minteri TaxID=331657 RepID=A0A4U0XW82_9PEZI|nr:hypothetical protein B0A49_00178 [Cryomyces minteri]
MSRASDAQSPSMSPTLTRTQEGAFRSYRSSAATPSQSMPASQESHLTASSSKSNVPGLQTSSSNVSQKTDADTQQTASTSSNSQLSRFRSSQPSQGWESSTGKVPFRQPPPPTTPPNDTGIAEGTTAETNSTTTSPMSLASPTSLAGTKRSANGHVKPVEISIPNSPVAAARPGRSRAESLSSSGSRAGEAAHQLKARLAYAMVKVQNGWENRSLKELENYASRKALPGASNATINGSAHRPPSPTSTVGRTPLYRGLSDDSDQYATSSHDQMSPTGTSRTNANAHDSSMSPPSKRRSGTYASFWASQDSNAASRLLKLQSATTAAPIPPSLAPAANIIPSRGSRRSISTHTPPMLSSIKATAAASSHLPFAAPQTPGRPSILRGPTATAQAEQDAVESLLFMSSPKNSGHFPHTSQTSTALPSPLRTDFPTPKRVVFESGDARPGTASSSGGGGGGGGCSDMSDAGYQTQKESARRSKPGGRSEEIERILDEVESSSGDEEDGGTASRPGRA